MGRLDNKVAIITGAASGMGAADARLFLKEGAKVVITDLNEDAGQALAAELGDSALFVRQNVADEENWNTVVQAARDTLGRIDMLANDAGDLLMKGVEETTVDEFNRIMAINVGGVFSGMKAVALIMRQQGGGAIINMSSAARMVGQVQTVAYSASKSDAMDSRPCGLRVISIHPGVAPDAPLPLAPLNRTGSAEEVANVVAFAASGEAS